MNGNRDKRIQMGSLGQQERSPSHLNLSLEVAGLQNLRLPNPSNRYLSFCKTLISLLITGLMLILNGAPVLANPYAAPPLSFSNAELRGHDFSGQNLRAAEFSNANLEAADFSNARAQGAVFSASVMTKTDMHGADLRDAMLDQSKFLDTDLSDVDFTNAILLGSTFENVDITGADFTNALLDLSQVKTLCKMAEGANSKTGIDTRYSLGCRD